MSIIKMLRNLLKQSLPSLHAARLNVLMAAVEAGLSGASVSITALGRALSGPAFIKHKIKRMDRLAGNRHLKSERLALYGAMARWLLKSLPLPVIIFDWSPVTADQSQQLLRAALPVGGRAITLYEEIHPRAKLGNRRVQQQFLARLQQLLPPHVTPIAVADSGFRTPFFREVERLGWPFDMLRAGMGWDGFATGISSPLPTDPTTGWRQNRCTPKRPANPRCWACPIGCAAILYRDSW